MAVVALVAIYLSIDGQSNTVDAACVATSERAAALDGLAIGQLAAFRVASEPESLSEMVFETPDGNAISIADFEGRVILLNFWATWCVPCREEMPALNQLEAELGGEDFQVVAVSLDTTNTPDGPQDFLTEFEIDQLSLFVDPGARLLGDIRSIGLRGGLPTTILLDEHGCTLGVIEGPAEWAGPDAIALIEAAIAE